MKLQMVFEEILMVSLSFAPSINFKIGQTYILFVGQTYQNYLDSGIGAHLIYLVRFELQVLSLI